LKETRKETIDDLGRVLSLLILADQFQIAPLVDKVITRLSCNVAAGQLLKLVVWATSYPDKNVSERVLRLAQTHIDHLSDRAKHVTVWRSFNLIKRVLL
jgi:hypothetical protein